MGKQAKARKARRVQHAVVRELERQGVQGRALAAHREMMTVGFQVQMQTRWKGKNADHDLAALARDAAALLRDRGVDTTDIQVAASMGNGTMHFIATPTREAVDRCAREAGHRVR